MIQCDSNLENSMPLFQELCRVTSRPKSATQHHRFACLGFRFAASNSRHAHVGDLMLSARAANGRTLQPRPLIIPVHLHHPLFGMSVLGLTMCGTLPKTLMLCPRRGGGSGPAIARPRSRQLIGSPTA